MAQHSPVIEELLDRFVVSNSIKGQRRAALIHFRTLANGLARDFEDSSELLQVLNLLLEVRDIAEVAAINPHPIPETAELRTTGIKGGGVPPEVYTGKS